MRVSFQNEATSADRLSNQIRVKTMSPRIYVVGAINASMEEQLSSDFSLIYETELGNPAQWLDEHGATISYVLTNGLDGISNDRLIKMPNLALISNNGVGYDAIDVLTMREKNVIVTHTPDVLNEEVATTAMLLMISCYRDFLANEAYARSGAWEKQGHPPLSQSADNRTVGIVGLGRIGYAIARKLSALNARILYHNRNPRDVPFTYFPDLVEMAKAADTLIVVTPGGQSTNALINREVFEALGPDGVFINVSRGSVVDEEALIHALEHGHIAKAGLDVFAKEPHIPTRLKQLDNVVLLPHVGSATIETRGAMGQLTIDNIIEHHRTGKVITPVPETRDIAAIVADRH